MKTFLTEVVQDLLKNGHPLAQTICVLPSERAGVFLKESLKKQVSETTFLPEILSIENFVERVSKLQKIDAVPLLFEFYQVYLEQAPEPKESFDSFAQWGAIALQDFNEIDRHLVKANELFLYLKDIKRIESWELNTDIAETDMMANHFAFMERLGQYYKAFTNYLLENKKGYQGLLYREATKQLDDYIRENATKSIVLIGFNALNKAEEYLFKELLSSGIAKTYWDTDSYYMNNAKEAGFFLRKYKSEWAYFEKHSFSSIASNFSKEKLLVQIAASKNVSQIKAVGALLASKENLDNTALVLADESLLSLTLNSLPDNVDKLNITMGYFLKDMPIAGFFEALFEMYNNQVKLDKVHRNEFYYKDVLRVLEHPFLYKILGSSDEISLLKTYIVEHNQIFVSSQKLLKLANIHTGELSISGLFLMTQNVDQFTKKCIHFLTYRKDAFEGFERECLYRYFNLFSQLENLNGKYKHIQSLKTLQSIYKQLVSSEKLSFQGEPLSGLQLMGMLETRVLDFETVIITSLNEGILPAGKNENSFIPFDVKKEYGLPTYQEKDAIFAYHFYRLIQRAKQVYLLYNTETDAYGAGEKSRFLTQLEIEGIPMVKKTIAPLVVSEKLPETQVSKTKEVLHTLKAIAGRGFSPSALSTYITDPMSYYKRYVLGIKEIDTVEETIAANTLGTVVHEVLDLFYRPLEGKYLKVQDIEAMLPKTEATTLLLFEKHYSKGGMLKGKNQLILKVAERFVKNFLHAEIQLLKSGKELQYLGAEKQLEASIAVDGLDFPIKIKGTVDRIDKLDGVVRIIDYKTGLVTASQLKMNDFEKTRQDYKYTKALQVMLYAFLYANENKKVLGAELHAGIYSFRNTKGGFLQMNFGNGNSKDFNITEDRIIEFMEVVKGLISELFDHNIPFIVNPDRPTFLNK